LNNIWREFLRRKKKHLQHHRPTHDILTSQQVNPEYEAAIEESYWKSVHRFTKKGSRSDGLPPSWLLESLQGDKWQESFMS
jgi:hypothetical protein